jgi:hypothetical protein
MKHCIINTEDRQITDYITSLGFICVPVVPSPRVSAPICAHADVLYRKINNNTIIISSCQKANLPLLEKLGYNVLIEDGLQPGYKSESLLNYINNDKYVIYNPKTAFPDENLFNNKTAITIKQGYTRCSTLSVTDTAYITDDKSIYNALIKNNLDCLLIEKGNIRLKGYDYGFIGGASVKLNEKQILFFGDILNKEDKNKVISFIKKYNIEPLFISDKKLTDIGSAIIL